MNSSKSEVPAKSPQKVTDTKKSPPAMHELSYYEKGMVIIAMATGFAILVLLYSFAYPPLKEIVVQFLIGVFILNIFVYGSIVSGDNSDRVRNSRRSYRRNCCLHTITSGRYYCECGRVVVDEL